MHITQKFLAFTLLGGRRVLWLLIVLSCASLAIMIERAWFFTSYKGVEGEVIDAGLAEADRGAEAVGEAMLSAKARVKLRLERNLAVLGTLGNNTPFIGLFGTVLGIIKASHDLTAQQATGGAAASAVM